MHILIVEDEHKIAHSIKKGLEQESYDVDVAYDGQQGVDMAISKPYDCIILDLMLPKLDGITVCTQLREEHIHTPILMLTAKGHVDEKVAGLQVGADDYLAKPFAFAELIARIQSLLRRPKNIVHAVLTIDNLSLNTTTFEVTRQNSPITLSKREFRLLEFLMKNTNMVISKDTIIEHVWEYDSDVLPNTVEVYIGYLRTKIDKSGLGKPLIHTMRGFGYKISQTP